MSSVLLSGILYLLGNEKKLSGWLHSLLVQQMLCRGWWDELSRTSGVHGSDVFHKWCKCPWKMVTWLLDYLER